MLTCRLRFRPSISFWVSGIPLSLPLDARKFFLGLFYLIVDRPYHWMTFREFTHRFLSFLHQFKTHGLQRYLLFQHLGCFFGQIRRTLMNLIILESVFGFLDFLFDPWQLALKKSQGLCRIGRFALDVLSLIRIEEFIEHGLCHLGIATEITQTDHARLLATFGNIQIVIDLCNCIV